MTLVLTPSEIIEKLEKTGELGLLGKAPTWERRLLGELVQVQNGAPFASSRFNHENKGMPLIRIRDVGTSETSTFYDGEFDPIFIVHKGDLLVGMDGDFRCAKWASDDALLNQRVCRIVVMSDELDERFLFLILQGYLDAIWKETSATTVKHLSSKSIQQIPIPLPPLPEQQKIVEVLEGHLSRLDAALADVCSASSKSSKLKLAILGKVFSGDFFEFDMPIMRVEEVARVMNGDRGKNYPNKSARVRSGVAFINAGHLDNDVLNVEEMDFISEERFNLLAAGKVELNDLLFCLRGSLGKVAINDKFSKGAIASSLAILRVNSKVLSKYLYYYFMSPLAAVEIRKYDNGTAQPNLSAANLKKFEVPVPSIEQQNRIVDFLDSELSLTIQTKQTLDSVFLTASTLRRSLLQAAFTGQLTKEEASV